MKEVVKFESLWDDGSLPPHPDAVSSFASGGWIVSDGNANLVYRFAPNGAYAGLLARRGSGPGEFRQPSLVTRWWGDSTAVFDDGNARLTVYSPTGEFGRSQAWSGGQPPYVMLSAGGGFIVSMRYATRSSFGMPLHLFSPKAELVRSFGKAADAKIAVAEDVPRLRLPTRSQPDGSYWTVDARAPRVQKWSQTGELLTTWDLPIPGFDPLHVTRETQLVGEMFHVIEQLRGGWLLVAMAYRESRYAEALGPSRIVDNTPSIVIEDWGRYFNTRLLLLDPRSRSLVAMRDIDEYVGGNLGSGRVWAIAPGGENGQLVVIDVGLKSKF